MFFLLLLSPLAHADHRTVNLSGFLGQKSLDDKDWSELDIQFAFGVMVDIKKEHWPVSIAVDLIVSTDLNDKGSQKDEGYTVENHVGIRKIFKLTNSSIKPYVGGGVAFVKAELNDKNGGTTLSSDDHTVGTWAGGGMYVSIHPDFNLGLDVRYSEAELTLFDTDREAGGLFAGVTAGYHW